jgi:hypothetical protein
MKYFATILLSLFTLAISAVVLAGYTMDSATETVSSTSAAHTPCVSGDEPAMQSLQLFTFESGTMTELVDAMQHVWPEMNIVLDPDVAAMPVPSMKLPLMNAAGLVALFEGYEVADAAGEWHCEVRTVAVDLRTKLYYIEGSLYPVHPRSISPQRRRSWTSWGIQSP